jgi:hypothetical protein
MGNAIGSKRVSSGRIALIPAVIAAMIMVAGCATNGSGNQSVQQSVHQTLSVISALTLAGKATLDQGCATGVFPADRCARYQNTLSLAWFAEQQLTAAVQAFNQSPTRESAAAMARAQANAMNAAEAVKTASADFK